MERLRDAGAFEADLKSFVDASVSLSQRARRLKELDDKWSRMNDSLEEDGPAGEPEAQSP
jgi:hypothetical protein